MTTESTYVPSIGERVRVLERHASHSMYTPGYEFVVGWRATPHDDGRIPAGWVLVGPETTDRRATLGVTMRVEPVFKVGDLVSGIVREDSNLIAFRGKRVMGRYTGPSNSLNSSNVDSMSGDLHFGNVHLETSSLCRELPELPSFRMRNPSAWVEHVSKASALIGQTHLLLDDYQTCAYAARWAALIESSTWLDVSEVAAECASKADPSRLFAHGVTTAVALLAKHWAYGSELKSWHDRTKAPQGGMAAATGDNGKSGDGTRGGGGGGPMGMGGGGMSTTVGGGGGAGGLGGGGGGGSIHKCIDCGGITVEASGQTCASCLSADAERIRLVRRIFELVRKQSPDLNKAFGSLTVDASDRMYDEAALILKRRDKSPNAGRR